MRIILAALLSCMSFMATAQALEVSYYKPLEAAGGGYLEKNSNFVLHCMPQRSLFLFSAAETSQSSHQEAAGNIDMNIWLGTGQAWVYKDFGKNNLTQFSTSIQENKYLIEDALHPMQWKILDVTKEIHEIPVQKARCEHRGRSYTAWFAPSIPLNNGPWKLGGLPGLILEAYDDQKEVVFLFKSLKTRKHEPIRKPSSKGRQVSLETFLKINEKELKQYFEFLTARLKKNDGDFDVEVKMGNYSSWEILK